MLTVVLTSCLELVDAGVERGEEGRGGWEARLSLDNSLVRRINSLGVIWVFKLV